MKTIILDNGAKIILKNIKNDVACVGFMVDAGVKNEPKNKYGLAHTLEHVLLSSSVYDMDKNKDDIYVNGGTASSYTNYYAIGNGNDLEKMIDITLNIFLRPNFTNTNIKTEIENVREEKNIRRNNSKLINMVDNIFFDKTYLLNTETDETLDNISVQDIKNFYKNLYKPSNLTYIVIGSFNFEKIKKLIKKYLDDLPNPDTLPIYLKYIDETQNIPDYLENQSQPLFNLKTNYGLRNSTSSIVFYLGRYTPRHELYGAILKQYFENVIFNNLRKSGLAYHVEVSLADQINSVYTLYVVVSCSQVKYIKCIQTILNEFMTVKKIMLQHTLNLNYFTPKGNKFVDVFEDICYNSYYKIDEKQKMREYDSELKLYNPKELNKFCNSRFIKSKLNIFTYGNATITKQQIKKEFFDYFN